MQSTELIHYLDDLLDIPEHPDFSGAYNGVQVQLPETVNTIATAVDACAASAAEAAACNADLLIVHHGLLWNGTRRFVGDLYEQLHTLMRHHCGVYAAHLPLDGHPEFGNNALLSEQLGLTEVNMFGEFKGAVIGRIGTTDLDSAADAGKRLGYTVTEAVAPTASIKRLAVVSGSAGSLLQAALDAGADVLLTGEVDHHVRVAARDLGLGIWLGGHYATETIGVHRLGEHLAERFQLEHQFLDLPTGG